MQQDTIHQVFIVRQYIGIFQTASELKRNRVHVWLKCQSSLDIYLNDLMTLSHAVARKRPSFSIEKTHPGDQRPRQEIVNFRGGHFRGAWRRTCGYTAIICVSTLTSLFPRRRTVGMGNRRRRFSPPSKFANGAPIPGARPTESLRREITLVANQPGRSFKSPQDHVGRATRTSRTGRGSSARSTLQCSSFAREKKRRRLVERFNPSRNSSRYGRVTGTTRILGTLTADRFHNKNSKIAIVVSIVAQTRANAIG